MTNHLLNLWDTGSGFDLWDSSQTWTQLLTPYEWVHQQSWNGNASGGVSKTIYTKDFSTSFTVSANNVVDTGDYYSAKNVEVVLNRADGSFKSAIYNGSIEFSKDLASVLGTVDRFEVSDNSGTFTANKEYDLASGWSASSFFKSKNLSLDILSNDDFIIGSPNNDRIYGGPGNDALKGEAGDDLLHGNRGNDNIIGGTGQNTMRGGQGDDRIDGLFGEGNVIFGGIGQNEISVGNRRIQTGVRLGEWGVIEYPNFEYVSDGNRDRIYVNADRTTNPNGASHQGDKADVVRNLGLEDSLFVHGVEDSTLSFQKFSGEKELYSELGGDLYETLGGNSFSGTYTSAVGIYSNEILEVLVMTDFSAAVIDAITQGGFL